MIFRATAPLIILLAVVLACGGEKTNSTAATGPVESGPKCTLETFNQIKPGMTRQEVEALIGPGELQSENVIGKLRTELYHYKAGLMAGCSITYQNGKVVSRSQIGLN